MADRAPTKKPDEQYPLLKVEGGGDMGHPAPALATAPDWGVGVACKRNSRFSRWPEFISAIWMTLILCGISFLIFHVLGMGLHRRQQYIILKCNDSKPASNVYYHQIVPRGSQIPFVLYTEYLANMATKYPLLQFNVVFLLDDIFPNFVRDKRNSAIYSSWFYNNKLDDTGKDAVIDFQKRYQNVNVTIVTLSMFMAKTPLKYKWRVLPQEYLAFYARVYSVWQNGGIGMDLKTFNNDFHNRFYSDRRIDTILGQHNDGINTASYASALNRIDQDEMNAVFGMFSSLINHFLNHTRSFFNRTLPLPSSSTQKPSLVRTHRNKRDAVNLANVSETTLIEASNNSKDFYKIEDTLTVVTTNYSNDQNESNEVVMTKDPTTTVAENQSTNLTNFNNSKGNGSEVHQVILFYDFTIMTDSMAGPLFAPLMKKKHSTASKTIPNLLSINSEGTFIAASSRFHPLLAHVSSAGFFGMQPKFALLDAVNTQCSGAFKDDVYCDNIYILLCLVVIFFRFNLVYLHSLMVELNVWIACDVSHQK